MTGQAPPHAKLSAAVAVVLIGGAVATMSWIGVALWQLNDNTTFQLAGACNICGRVERVRELERASPAPLPLTGDRGESIVMMIAALGGRMPNTGALSFRTYETAVRLDDGSVRILRENVAPPWKAGDRVRVMRGRVEPLSREG